MTMASNNSDDNTGAKPEARPGARLAQDIVIEGAPIDAPVGAQAIAPDHVPRSLPSTERAVRQVARPASVPTTDTLREIEQLLYRQSELLDSKLWQDYIDL